MASPLSGACNGTFQVYGFGIIMILGSFAPNGSSALVATSTKGKGFSVAYTSTGTYTLTFNYSSLAVLSAWLTPQMHAANVDTSLQFGDVDTSTALTAVIRNNPGGSVADITANANNRIHFGFCMASSSLNT